MSVFFSSSTTTTATFYTTATIGGTWANFRWELWHTGPNTRIANFFSTNTSQTFGNSNPLQSGQSYTCVVYGVRSDSTESQIGSASGSTQTQQLEQLGPPFIDYVTPSYTSATVYFFLVPGAESYTFRAAYTNGTVISTASGSSSPIVISGLPSGTNIVIEGMSIDTNGSHTNSGWFQGWAGVTLFEAPNPPQFTSVVSGQNQISLSWTTVSNATGYEVGYSIVGGNGVWTTSTTASTSTTITGLQNGTSYYFRVRASGNWGWTNYSTNVVATPTPPRPSNFSWSTSKASGGNFNLTASEWNSFISKINDFRIYRGLTSFSFTLASPGNTFTASIYNQAWDAINTLSGRTNTTMPSSASSGGNITAYHLNQLVDSLNSTQ